MLMPLVAAAVAMTPKKMTDFPYTSSSTELLVSKFDPVSAVRFRSIKGFVSTLEPFAD